MYKQLCNNYVQAIVHTMNRVQTVQRFCALILIDEQYDVIVDVFLDVFDTSIFFLVFDISLIPKRI